MCYTIAIHVYCIIVCPLIVLSMMVSLSVIIKRLLTYLLTYIKMHFFYFSIRSTAMLTSLPLYVVNHDMFYFLVIIIVTVVVKCRQMLE